MTVRICSHRRLLLPMQSDVLNESQQQQQLSNESDCSSSLSTTTTTTATTLIYSGLKLHPKPLVPTISMPGVASPLSIVKKLSLPDAHLDNSNPSIRHTTPVNPTTTTAATPSSIRLVTPTNKPSPPTSLQFQLTEKSSVPSTLSSSSPTTTNGGFSTPKTYIFNPQANSTATVNKQQTLPNVNSSSSLLTLIPPGTTSPKVQTLNSVTISSTNDASANELSTKSSSNQNQSVFLSKNRVTLVQPIITSTAASANSLSNNGKHSTPSNTITPKLVIQQNTNAAGINTNFWPQAQPTQATKIFSFPQSSILPTAKMLSRPVQLIPTSLSSSEQHHHHPHHHHHHPQITHVQTVKTEKHDGPHSYPISMHFGLSSPATEHPLSPLNVQVNHPHAYATKNFDSSGHQAYIHMQLLPSTSTSESLHPSQPVHLTRPTTHLYSSPSSVLISTTQRSMDHNNNHQSTTPATITTPIVREMQIDEKHTDLTTIKNIHHGKVSTKSRARLPLQPSAQQISSTLAASSTSMTPTSSSLPTNTTIRQPKKHKLLEDEQTSSNEPPTKLPHYEQLDSPSTLKTPSKSRHRPLSKFSIENTTPVSNATTPTSLVGVDASGISRKRNSAESANAALQSRKKRPVAKPSQGLISNENMQLNVLSDRVNGSPAGPTIDQIDDELLKRLSQDFVYFDQRTGLRWIGTKARPKPMSTLVSRFSWKPKINHYEKYSDIIRTNPKRTVPVKSIDTIRKKLTQPWASWRIDRLTAYLTDLTHDEQMTQNHLSDIVPLLNIEDPSMRSTIQDLIEANIQRHRCFYEQLTQISSLLVNLLDHGNTLRELCSMSKPNPTTKRTKDR